uniref:hypothetical protein n=1 Tax=Thaumasiovibrio occultus TaxID=1891184 RepID=UPI000B351AF4|nr:hypothetical protein [Thaumasiovibrio occultus]
MNRILVALLFLSGCSSNLYLAGESNTLTPEQTVQKVFVTNAAQQPDEYAILQQSGLYQFVAASETEHHLTLMPNTHIPMQFEYSMLEVVGLGLIPVTYEYHDIFAYEMAYQGNVAEYRHTTPIVERVSIWESLLTPFSDDRDTLIARGLLVSPPEVIAK